MYCININIDVLPYHIHRERNIERDRERELYRDRESIELFVFVILYEVSSSPSEYLHILQYVSRF